jgi:hypothetical protein
MWPVEREREEEREESRESERVCKMGSLGV